MAVIGRSLVAQYLRMMKADNKNIKIVTYNIDEIFLTTLHFALNMCGFLYLAKLELYRNDEFSKEDVQKDNFNPFLGAFLKDYTSDILTRKGIEPYLLLAVETISEVSSDELISFHNKVKCLKVNEQVEFDLNEMITLYCLLHLSCLSFLTGIDDIHRYHVSSKEYGDIRKIILTSMKLFMGNIAEWVSEYPSFEIVREKLNGISKCI